MAEIVVSAFFTVFFEKMASEAFNRLARSQGIHSELKRLKSYLSLIKALLNDAAEKEITNQAVKQWLNGLHHLTYDIDDVFEDLQTEAIDCELKDESGAMSSKVRKFIPTCCTNFSLSTRMQGRLDDITNKLKELVDQKNDLGLVVKEERPKKGNRNKEPCLPEFGIVGREGEKKALLHKLLGDEPCNEKFSIVPIIGMGGVGKTTLARLLYNDEKVKDHFQLKAWVCVSDEFDIFYISQVLYQYVTGENKEFKDLSLLQVALSEELKDKRFLIVLDDVWSESYDDWKKLVRPFHSGTHGSKIIITTRKDILLKKLGHDHLASVESLSFNDALSLFAQHSLGVNDFDSHPMLKPYGVGIVKKCGGLPLGLKTLGRLLRTKTDVNDWDDILNNEIWELDNGDDSIVRALRLSYHDLDACLKQLFAYCSLFPKDYLFDKEELILLWMAEGFLKQSKTVKSMERLGHEYFDALLSRSFFQQSPNEESLYMMHDLMNDFAMSVAGDFFLRLNVEKKKEAFEKYRHMSFIREDYVAYDRFKGFQKSKYLRTFLALSVGVENNRRHYHLSNKILVELLPKLSLLRVLHLSCFSITELPESIGSLKHLRYLNLSRTQITHLPESICILYNLQTLILFACYSLFKLPNSFINLKNLRHFDIRGTSFIRMPLGIDKLKNLQTLPRIVIGGDNGFAIPEINNPYGKISIMGLDKIKNTMLARAVNLSEKRLSELEMEWSDKFEDRSRKETLEIEVLDVLKPHHDNLKKLMIKSYGGIKFPNWMGDPSFLLLTCVSIYGCKKCTTLPPLGQLPSLRELYIGGMNGVKVVGSEFFGTCQAFPSLEVLRFKDMLSWEVWSTNSRFEDVAFPCLQELHVENCPKLVQISVEALPSLGVLNIIKCGDVVLRSLVHVTSSSIISLSIHDISGLCDDVCGGVLQHLGTVEKVIIFNCQGIRYLWKTEAEASKVLVKLRKLDIQYCYNLVRLGEKEAENSVDENNLLLTYLKILHCKNMEHCRCPNSIEELQVRECDSITFVFFPTRKEGGERKLKSLWIEDVKKVVLEKEELGGGGEKKSMLLINNTTNDMPLLESICIRRLENLEWITELRSFVHLNRLEITDCPNMKSFPDHELQNLTMLTHLEVTKCPMMDDCFPVGFGHRNCKALE